MPAMAFVRNLVHIGHTLLQFAGREQLKRV